jgi:hypothetical protein
MIKVARAWKKVVVDYFKALSQDFLEGLRKTKEIFRQYSPHPCQESNPVSPYTRQEY